MKRNLLFPLILGIIVIGIIFRFYDLNWGAPFYFHPDERNIASSISQLRFPEQLNPHFFAYGTIPIYIVFATGLIVNFLNTCNLSFNGCSVYFEQAIIIGRIYSAILSIFVIPLLFIIGTTLKNKTVGILAGTFALFSVGLIQFSHFSTFEMWLTFFSLLLFYLCLLLMEKIKLRTVFLIGIVVGILIGIKVSSIILLAFPFVTLILSRKSKNIKHISFLLLCFLLICLSGFLTFSITNLFTFLDFKSFQSTFQYESSLALGTIPVFYTGEFYGSIPVLFQFQKIYPFILNPVLTIFFIPSFLYVIFLCLKTRNKRYILLTTCYLLLFLSQAVLYAKWTRYVIPTLPFMYLIIAVSLDHFFQRKKHGYFYAFIIVLIIFSLIFSFSYVKTAFLDSDTRIQASLWAKEDIPENSKIVSEIYDMGIVPFNPYFSDINLFNFYELDNNAPDWTTAKLTDELKKTDYIILPSQRLYQTRMQHPNEFPNGYTFYKNLFDGSLGFTKMYETPCDIFCKLIYLNNPMESFEQTASVFDRPNVVIFKKR